ncbi:hypothetical protein SLS62_001190 [Diatrype stigma]|uniref:Uncharacterized protein n=1 Tax=Diatrype stigma TaxID=117547 RepID=A0AAN9V0G7_9PEZI
MALNPSSTLPYPLKHNVTSSSDFEIFMDPYDFPLNHSASLVVSHTRSLAYELAYWRWALDAACDLRRRLGREHVTAGLKLLFQVDGMYAPWEGLNGLWWDDATLRAAPRSAIVLQGIIPDSPAVRSSTQLYGIRVTPSLFCILSFIPSSI